MQPGKRSFKTLIFDALERDFLMKLSNGLTHTVEISSQLQGKVGHWHLQGADGACHLVVAVDLLAELGVRKKTGGDEPVVRVTAHVETCGREHLCVPNRIGKHAGLEPRTANHGGEIAPSVGGGDLALLPKTGC